MFCETNETYADTRMLYHSIICYSRIGIPQKLNRYLTNNTDTEVSTTVFRLLKNTEYRRLLNTANSVCSVSAPPWTSAWASMHLRVLPFRCSLLPPLVIGYQLLQGSNAFTDPCKSNVGVSGPLWPMRRWRLWTSAIFILYFNFQKLGKMSSWQRSFTK